MPIPFIAIAAAISAASSAGGAVAGASGAAKQRMYQKNLDLLTLDQKKALEKQLMGAKSEEARQAILASTLGAISSARVQALGDIQKEKEKTKKVLLITGASIVGLLLLVLIIKKK